MAHERLLKLMKSHRVRIARALVRQVRVLVPRYRQLEENAHEKSYLALLLGIENFLETGNADRLMDTSAHVAQLRAATGFRLEDFVVGALGFLPVLRHFLLEKSNSLHEALEDYDALEAASLPLIGQSAALFSDTELDATQPDGKGLEALRAYSKGLKPLRIERVTGEASDEELFPSIT